MLVPLNILPSIAWPTIAQTLRKIKFNWTLFSLDILNFQHPEKGYKSIWLMWDLWRLEASGWDTGFSTYMPSSSWSLTSSIRSSSPYALSKSFNESGACKDFFQTRLPPSKIHSLSTRKRHRYWYLSSWVTITGSFQLSIYPSLTTTKDY